MALERWFGFGEDTYNLARKSTETLAFKYAAGAESVRALTGWGDSEAVWWVTYVLCDYALHTLTRNHVFFRGAQLVAEEWPVAPPLDALEDIYALLLETFDFAEVKSARDDIFRHVSSRLQSLQDGDDPMDRSIAAILHVMDQAIAQRHDNPSYFASTQLRDPSERRFVETFHMPTISTQKGISFTSRDEPRAEAVLYLVSAFHRVLSIVSDDYPRVCPFSEHDACQFERTDACQFERTDACRNQPWNRIKQSEGTVCIYRFVDHGFEAARQE